MFDLHYDGECIANDLKTIDEAINWVRIHYEGYVADKEVYPDSFDDYFDFDGYEVFQHIKVDFESILTTNHRGSFPKSDRAEGVNFID